MELSQEYLIRLEKRNFNLRIGIIIILFLIGLLVLYNNYGVKPSLEDQELTKTLFGQTIKVIDCREALIYYAEHELKTIDRNQAVGLMDEYNISYLN